MPNHNRRSATPSPSTGGPTMVAEGQPGGATTDTHLVVGIGASAGGLDAYRAFFSKMPADSGMAFVLVQHLDPKYESTLVAIVAGFTPMPVRLAEESVAVRPNHVYVIPRDAILTIARGSLHLTRPAPPAARRMSIDTFLTSLAEDQAENAVGIILSGFGSDGARGVAAVKEHGGLTLSQAEFDHHAKSGMPQSAASSGFVDHVLAVEDMPEMLLTYREHRSIQDASKGPDGIRQDLPTYLTTICAVLHARLGRDFSQYKTGTLMRRIQRRMHVLQTADAPAYIDQLRSLPHEADSLFRELLISVTRFFRDPAAFASLETEIIPLLLAETPATDPIRVWVAGCATGEEAYSVAILLREGLARAESRRPIQVFATDVDDRAIEFARVGLYPAAISADLSAERLERNFVKENDHYRVHKDLREPCLFSSHDLLKDPPYSRLDLVCCRNLLIYFDSRLQQRVFATFHYALRPGRFLFLGSSESVTAQSRLFAPVDKRHRLYARRDTAVQLPSFPLSHASHRSQPAKRAVLPTDEVDRWATRAMARHLPAFLVVDRQHDIVRFFGQTAKYLGPTAGTASLNLFSLLHTDLRAPARSALSEIAQGRPRVSLRIAKLATGGRTETVNLIVEPLAESGSDGLLVIAFQDVPPVAEAAPVDVPEGGTDDETQALNTELLATRERLSNLAEELQAANEELQSSNEEFLSVNEELQSANEELETSKEELQSLNEELQTINAELNQRNDSLVRSNSDLANLFDSTSIATLFLDSGLRIRRFTPKLLEIFNVREGDEGRPITDIVTRLAQSGLSQDLRRVLGTLAPIEHEVSVAESGVPYLMQVRPYRDLKNVVDGAVVTFVDLSERKKSEQDRALLAAIVESSQYAITSFDLDGTVTSWNVGAEQLFGCSSSDAVGKAITTLLDDVVGDQWPELRTRLEKGERVEQIDIVRPTENDQPFAVSMIISPVKSADGRVVGGSLVAQNISKRKAAERKAELLLGELDHRVKNILAVVSAVVSQTLKSSASPKAFAVDIDGRIRAIAKAHSLLTRSGQGELSVRAVVETELAPYEQQKDHLTIAGPDVSLTPKAGLAFAMAVHELASNAAKYGALSVATGRLTVEWTVTGGPADRVLTFAWTESDGPTVTTPERRGFGTTMIEQTLTYELKAEVEREFNSAGLHCTIAIPLTEEIGLNQPAGKAGGSRDARR
ncbi:MAG: CheR family methyltransferase [Inquilinus sp.]|uniref:CheR family methyltransferase n=1 Tax=Inquilinus sp. TaxID=1932117 RepID=UPI003F3A80CD